MLRLAETGTWLSKTPQDHRDHEGLAENHQTQCGTTVAGHRENLRTLECDVFKRCMGYNDGYYILKCFSETDGYPILIYFIILWQCVSSKSRFFEDEYYVYIYICVYMYIQYSL